MIYELNNIKSKSLLQSNKSMIKQSLHKISQKLKREIQFKKATIEEI